MTSPASPAQPWYLYPISKSFNGASEKGVDLQVPYHTPVSPLFPGTVSGVSYGPYGAEVNVTGNVNGQPVTAAYVHLDTVNAAEGQAVGPGSLLGYSGGQTVGGYHPASPLYSSGPHIEFSLWPDGTTPYVGRPYDPTQFVNAVQQSGGGLLATLGNTVGNTVGSAVGGVGGAWAQSAQQAGVMVDPTALGNALGSAYAGALGAGTAYGVSAGISSGFGTLGQQFWSSTFGQLGIATFQDALWRTVLIIAGLVVLAIAVSALVGRTSANTSAVILNSAPAKAATGLAGVLK